MEQSTINMVDQFANKFFNEGGVSLIQARKFAAEVGNIAFIEGAAWCAKVNGISGMTVGEVVKEANKRYSYEETDWRTSEQDSCGYEWQVRDGITWYRTRSDRSFIKHVDVASVMSGMASCNEFDRIKILADIAANPKIKKEK